MREGEKQNTHIKNNTDIIPWKWVELTACVSVLITAKATRALMQNRQFILNGLITITKLFCVVFPDAISLMRYCIPAYSEKKNSLNQVSCWYF